MTAQKRYYSNHQEERKAYQKQWRLNHLGYDKQRRQKPKKEFNIDDALIKDIKSFIPLCHRKPTIREVLDWSEMYGRKNMQDGTKWARRLIKKAINGMVIPKKAHTSSFVLYDQRVNEVNILQGLRLKDMALK